MCSVHVQCACAVCMCSVHVHVQCACAVCMCMCMRMRMCMRVLGSIQWQWRRNRPRTYRSDRLSPSVAHPQPILPQPYILPACSPRSSPHSAGAARHRGSRRRHRREGAPSPTSAVARLLRTLHPPGISRRPLPSWHPSPRDVHRRRRGRPHRLSSWTTTRATRVEVALTRPRSRASRSSQRRQRCTLTCTWALNLCARPLPL